MRKLEMRELASAERMEIAYGKHYIHGIHLFVYSREFVNHFYTLPLPIYRSTISVACPTLPINRSHCEETRQIEFVTNTLTHCNFLLKLTRWYRLGNTCAAILSLTSVSQIRAGLPRIRTSFALFRSSLCSRICRSYTMDYWLWRRCVRAETPFSADFARSYVTRDITRTMSSISKYYILSVVENTRVTCQFLQQRFLINF